MSTYFTTENQQNAGPVTLSGGDPYLIEGYPTDESDVFDSTLLQTYQIATGTITPFDGDLDFSNGVGLAYFNEAVTTASPNNTVNNVSLTAVGDTTNVSVAIVPKGTGAFSLAVPDGTAAGGNVRGANAVDLQIKRQTQTQVASGADSFVAGNSNTASASGATAIGTTCIVSGNGATAIGLNNICSQGFALSLGRLNNSSAQSAVTIGYNNTASGTDSIAIGNTNTSSNFGSSAIGIYNSCNGVFATCVGTSCINSGMFATSIGYAANADRSRIIASSADLAFSAIGAVQRVYASPSGKTTNNTPTLLSPSLQIPSGKILQCRVEITGVRSDGVSVAIYERKVRIKNVGGTTSLIGSVLTLGTDHEDAATAIDITADNTADTLKIMVTGIAAETWRWAASIEAFEVAYGT